jgi:hypothetical protein
MVPLTECKQTEVWFVEITQLEGKYGKRVILCSISCHSCILVHPSTK